MKSVLADHSIIELIVSCKASWTEFVFFPWHNKFKLPANSVASTKKLIASHTSFKIMRNRVTDSVDPWETPFDCTLQVNKWSLILTWKVLSVKKSLSLYSMFNFLSMPGCKVVL